MNDYGTINLEQHLSILLGAQKQDAFWEKNSLTYR